ncbi:C-type lectin domain family 4 member A-like [Engraulis encrasicolus]|uniref:C-type lectin domain family 4 member A-like n=1 Tax=Engraulis encrasicolus TaxID=184585 RepID=UPI002FD11F04
MSEPVVYSEVKFKNGPSPKNNTTGTGGPQLKETSEDEVVYSSVVISKTPASNQQDPKELSLPNDAPPAERSKGKCRCPRLLLVMVVLCILILALGLAVGLALYLTGTLSTGKPEEETATKQIADNRHTTDTPQGSTSEGNKEPAVTDPSKECQEHTCKSGWEYHGSHCYYFSNKTGNWSRSKDKCQGMKSHLAIIDNKEEQIFLMEQIKNRITDSEDKFWIGLNDMREENEWRWVDNTTLNNSKAFWLHEKEPDDWKGTPENPHPEGEDCVRMGETSFDSSKPNGWVDTGCHRDMRFICETGTCGHHFFGEV